MNMLSPAVNCVGRSQCPRQRSGGGGNRDFETRREAGAGPSRSSASYDFDFFQLEARSQYKFLPETKAWTFDGSSPKACEAAGQFPKRVSTQVSHPESRTRSGGEGFRSGRWGSEANLPNSSPPGLFLTVTSPIAGGGQEENFCCKVLPG